MKESFLVFMSCTTLAALCLPAHAQKQGTIPRIGIVRAGGAPAGGAPDLFVEGLRSLGYIEGKNIFFEIRYAEGNRDCLREFATELVRLNVDAIFTASSPAMFALKEAMVGSQAQLIIETARTKGFATMYHEGGLATEGALASYGISDYGAGLTFAKYVQHVLSGTKPKDLPVETVDKIELVINLKTTRQIGLTIPQRVLTKADKVIR